MQDHNTVLREIKISKYFRFAKTRLFQTIVWKGDARPAFCHDDFDSYEIAYFQFFVSNAVSLAGGNVSTSSVILNTDNPETSFIEHPFYKYKFNLPDGFINRDQFTWWRLCGGALETCYSRQGNVTSEALYITQCRDQFPYFNIGIFHSSAENNNLVYSEPKRVWFKKYT